MSGTVSKQLGHDDQSGFDFAQEMLCGDKTAAVNFDRLQRHPKYGYIMVEYLLCEEDQSVTPYTSHPSRYWNRNAAKFLALWRAALDFHATLLLINYAKKGTRAENEVLLIQVLDMDETGIRKESQKRFTRAEFSTWFRRLNEECLEEKSALAAGIYRHKTTQELGAFLLSGGKYKGKSLAEIYDEDPSYLQWMKGTDFPFAAAAGVYWERREEEKQI